MLSKIIYIQFIQKDLFQDGIKDSEIIFKKDFHKKINNQKIKKNSNPKSIRKAE